MPTSANLPAFIPPGPKKPEVADRSARSGCMAKNHGRTNDEAKTGRPLNVNTDECEDIITR